MDLSVIIVSYNVRFFLEQCILSVYAASERHKIEIIVIDNNSEDCTCEVIKSKFPLVKLVENQINIGFSKANNQGVKLAKGDYVLILNPDTIVSEDTFSKILRLPPKTSAIACCPRQTPKIRFVSAYLSIIAFNNPASSGIPGPGESTIFSKASTSSKDNWSFRFTTTSQSKSSR